MIHNMHPCTHLTLLVFWDRPVQWTTQQQGVILFSTVAVEFTQPAHLQTSFLPCGFHCLVSESVLFLSGSQAGCSPATFILPVRSCLSARSSLISSCTMWLVGLLQSNLHAAWHTSWVWCSAIQILRGGRKGGQGTWCPLGEEGASCTSCGVHAN